MARWHNSPAVLDAARLWRDRCLLADGSILSDRHLWTLENIAHLERHFVQNLDTGTGTFFSKLEEQLAPSPPGAKQLAAEMLWLLYLSVSENSIKGSTKRMQIRQVWGWSGELLPESPMLGDPLEVGVANPGTGFQTNRWRELVFCIELTREWKRLASPEQLRLISDPWLFSAWLDAQPGADVRQFRHMLLYLLFPDHFERVVTGSHKQLILKTFRPQAGFTGSVDFRDRTAVDRALYELRPLLDQRYGGEIVDYYREPVRSDWLHPKDTAGSGGTTGGGGDRQPTGQARAWQTERFRGAQVWLIAPGEGARLWPDFQKEGMCAIGWDYLGDLSAYSSYEALYDAVKAEQGGNPTNDARACWQFVNDVRVGDYMVAKQGRSALLGYGVVTSEYRLEDSRAEYQHVRSVDWKRVGHWALPDELAVVVKTFTDYTPYPEWLQPAFTLMDDEVASRRGIGPTGGTPPTKEPSIYTPEDALRELFLPHEQFTAIMDALARKKNVILEGAPGVGKTFVARRIAWAMLGRKDNRRVEMVQFHQSYAYEDFVQGWRPRAAGGFERQDGVFHRFCATAARDPHNRYVFIIDEINRGNLSKVFGELMMLIEPDKRGPDYAVPLTYSPDERFSVPENLFIIGMMNTADRSLAMVDYALRRRFSFVRLEPAFGSEAFAAHLVGEGVEESLVERIVVRMGELNRIIREDTRNLGPGFEIGHSFFVPARDEEGRDEAWFQRIVRYEIEPLLHEYWFDQPDRVREHVGRLIAT